MKLQEPLSSSQFFKLEKELKDTKKRFRKLVKALKNNNLLIRIGGVSYPVHNSNELFNLVCSFERKLSPYRKIIEFSEKSMASIK